MIELGVFLPLSNNGYIVSTASPQYQPSYAMIKAMTLLAEDLGFRFVLSPVKYRGWGGPTEFANYVLESFEVMAALAEATDRIQLYGSVALPTVHPAITARRSATIDHISQGRFGINLVSGWQQAEYAQMGLWPGDVHYQRRYHYAREYVDILKLLWTQRDVDYDGEFFHLRDCRILPHPEHPLPLVCAGQSDVGMQFTAQHVDYAFVIGDVSGTSCRRRAMASNSWRIPATAKYPMSTGMRRSVLATSGACVQKPKVGGVSITITSKASRRGCSACFSCNRLSPRRTKSCSTSVSVACAGRMCRLAPGSQQKACTSGLAPVRRSVTE